MKFRFQWNHEIVGGGGDGDLFLNILIFQESDSFFLIFSLFVTLGSWAEQNVNPALFSRELMANASSLVGDEEVCLLLP